MSGAGGDNTGEEKVDSRRRPTFSGSADTTGNDDKQGLHDGELDDNKEMNESDWTCVGVTRQFGARTSIKLHERLVTVLRLRDTRQGESADKWVCLDSVCYHAGGPLGEGVVRIVDGRVCLQCPWHRYLVDVDSGEGLYLDLQRRYQSKGARQRVHKVEIRQDHVWVQLVLGGEIASDVYAGGAHMPADRVDALPAFPRVDDW